MCNTCSVSNLEAYLALGSKSQACRPWKCAGFEQPRSSKLIFYFPEKGRRILKNILLFILLQLSHPPHSSLHPNPLLSHSLRQSPHHCPYMSCLYVLWLIPSLSYNQSPLPSHSCQSIPWFYASDFILFISLFCSLDSTYNWDHMVYVHLSLTGLFHLA